METKDQNVISCRGGLGVHVTRGERRILEMERHLKCMREKLTILETMLPVSVTNLKNKEDQTETDCQEGCPSLDGGKTGNEKGRMCVLQSLSIKEKKLREEIFNMEYKEKEYLNALSKEKVSQSNREEIKKPEENHDFTGADNFSPMSRKGESGEKEKFVQLEEYSKNLCDCLRTIQNNRKEWSQEAGYLSKELNSFEDDPKLIGNSLIQEEFLGFFKPERNEEKGNECPCGEPAKCNSCTICTCSDWEEDLELGGEEKPEEHKKIKLEKVNPVEKKSHCRCFQSSSDFNQSSKSLEINDIYNCSISKMQSEMSVATTSISSTVEDIIMGDEEDKKKFCCLCSPEDVCQKFCEICLCEWEREYRANQQLYLDDYDKCYLCAIGNQERFRGGTDLGISISKELCNKDFKQNLPNVMNQLTLEPEKKMKEENLDDSNKNLQIEELKINLQNLQNVNNALRKWLEDQNHQINFNSSKDKIIAALVDELKQNLTPNPSKIWKQPQKERIANEETPTKDLAIGLFVLLLTFLSNLLGTSGLFSLSFVFRFLFQILGFPFQMCIQIYRYLPVFYDTIREFIFNYSELLLNTFKNKNPVENYKFDSLLIFIWIFSFFGLVSFVLIRKTPSRFLLSIENFSPSIKFPNSPLEAVISSAVKNTLMLFLRPIIFLLIFIRYVLLFSLTLFSSLIDFCIPRRFRNLSYRIMSSFIDTFCILFKRKSSLWHASNLVYIIVGFLVNKMRNLNEVKMNLGFLKLFLNHSICETPELDQTKNCIEDSISEWFKPSILFYFLYMTVENIFEYARLIFRSFEIK